MNQRTDYLIQQAALNFNSNKLDTALYFLKESLKINPNHYDALQMIGVVLGLKNDEESALKYFLKALKINSKNYFLQFNVGNVYRNLSHYDLAIKHYKLAYELNSKFPELFLNMGICFAKLNDLSSAVKYFHHSLKLKSDYPEALFNLSSALFSLHQFDEALVAVNSLISLNESFDDVFLLKGKILNSLNRPSDALLCFDLASNYHSSDFDVFFHRANSYFILRDYTMSLECFNNALSIDPDSAEVLLLRGDLFNEIGMFHESLDSYKLAFNLDPNLNFVVGTLLHQKMKVCDWSSFDELFNLCCINVDLQRPTIQPFAFLGMTDDLGLQSKCAKTYALSFFTTPPIVTDSSNVHSDRIRLAYFSPDFNNHAVSNLTAELFESHDLDKFEIFGFYFGNTTEDSKYFRIAKAFGSNFFNVSHFSNYDLLGFIRSFNIDIAIDLAGFTQNSRSFIFSHRCAPIQINFIGYPGSMGCNFMDYIVADRFVIPDHLINDYSEKPLYLPLCFQPNDSYRDFPTSSMKSREFYGLPKDSFVFCCFNNSFKFNPRLFNLWSEILSQSLNSVLWIYADSDITRDNILSEMKSRYISSNRIFFAPRVSYPEYLERFKFADLFLDTFPFNGGTTASDALFSNLPILTLCGRSFASRMCASLLNSLNLTELITYSDTDYVKCAVELSNDPNLFNAIKTRLTSNLESTDLFNGKKYATNFEAALISAHSRRKNGLNPDVIFT